MLNTCKYAIIQCNTWGVWRIASTYLIRIRVCANTSPIRRQYVADTSPIRRQYVLMVNTHTIHTNTCQIHANTCGYMVFVCVVHVLQLTCSTHAGCSSPGRPPDGSLWVRGSSPALLSLAAPSFVRDACSEPGRPPLSTCSTSLFSSSQLRAEFFLFPLLDSVACLPLVLM